jgi:N-acetylglucosaminyldiphosphoundecaprenol N-acetyl-beta-D-mannosaminyltransferase
LITINAAVLVMMRKDAALAAACRAGALIVPDGMSVLWASRLVGRPLRARVAGVDLMAHLLETAAARALSVFFLGATEEVVQKLAALCESRYPGLVVAGYRNGYFKESDYLEVIKQIRRSGADILFVGMPTPFKEVWCEQHREALGVPVIMGVGGSFDVLTGLIRRAPLWMQNAGLEWFWRLLMEPRKMWKRYFVTNSIFIALSLIETMRRRPVSRSRSARF